MSTATAAAAEPIKTAITRTLQSNLAPIHLEVINESHMHNVPAGSESHFKVLVVSEQFRDLPLLKRHRLVNTLVKDELREQFVHALSIVTKTPEQWQPDYNVAPSPSCRGGFGK